MGLKNKLFDVTDNLYEKGRKEVKSLKDQAPFRYEEAKDSWASTRKKAKKSFSKLAKDSLKKPFQEWKNERKAEKAYVKQLAKERKRRVAEHEHHLKLREERRKLSEKYKSRARQGTGLPVVKLFEEKKK